jgi:hypothetical protein
MITFNKITLIITKNILFAIIILAFTSCSDDNDTIVISEDTVDIHVVGNVQTTGSNYQKAMYWKNNIPTLLDLSGKVSTASAVVVVNNNVYISGSVDGKACYWKNSEIVYLPDGTRAYDIKVIGNDVYVAGENNYVACYWKNGIKTSLGEPENESRAYGITVVGNDVYVCGNQSLGRYKYNFLPLYWKNNEAVFLGATDGLASDIVVSNSDLYIAGNDSNDWLNDMYRICWKNDGGVYVGVEENRNKIYTNGVTAFNKDVYVTGFIHSYMIHEAAYWKNGTTHLLTNASGSLMTDANDIDVLEDVVFVCGSEKFGYQPIKPKIWINNKEVFLDGDITEGEALGICVVKK